MLLAGFCRDRKIDEQHWTVRCLKLLSYCSMVWRKTSEFTVLGLPDLLFVVLKIRARFLVLSDYCTLINFIFTFCTKMFLVKSSIIILMELGKLKFLNCYIHGSLNKFPEFFRMGTFIDSTHIKLLSPSKKSPPTAMHLFYRSNTLWNAPWKSSCVSVSMTFVTASFISSILS